MKTKFIILVVLSFLAVSCSSNTMQKAKNTCDNPLSFAKKISCKFKGK